MRRPRDEALKFSNIEFNSGARIGWLLYDLDRDDAFDAWERADLPVPNFFAGNPSNGHGHLGYALTTPVGVLGASHEAPIRLLADVQRGMTRRLGADRAYTNRLAKNPVSDRWRTAWLAGQPYSLRALLDPLDKFDIAKSADRRDVAGVGRNCDLFDELRRFAYLNARAAKRHGRPDQWRDRLIQVAAGMNTGFATPLPISEVRSIARSVAKWTWSRFDDAKFSAIQSRRATARNVKRGTRTAVAIDTLQNSQVTSETDDIS